MWDRPGAQLFMQGGCFRLTRGWKFVASQDGQEAAALPPATEVLLLEEDDPVWKDSENPESIRETDRPRTVLLCGFGN